MKRNHLLCLQCPQPGRIPRPRTQNESPYIPRCQNFVYAQKKATLNQEISNYICDENSSTVLCHFPPGLLFFLFLEHFYSI